MGRVGLIILDREDRLRWYFNISGRFGFFKVYERVQSLIVMLFKEVL